MPQHHYVDICAIEDLTSMDGVCALVNGQQVAIFYIENQGIYAVSNYDPIGLANVISRGIIGDIRGQLVVASPLYKQHFSLLTGQCIEKPEVSLEVYPTRINQGRVEVAIGLSSTDEN